MLGYGADISSASASNECDIGSSSAPIREIYIGQGYANASNTNALTVHATGGSGSNIAGQRLNIAAGQGTGTGLCGALVLQYAPVGGSSSTLNALADGLTLGTAGNVTVNAGDLVINTAGKGLQIKEGSNAKMGTVTLSGGAATVSTTAVLTNSRIYLTSQVDGGTPGWLRVDTRTNATSFHITSSSGTDTSTVAWLIVEPSP